MTSAGYPSAGGGSRVIVGKFHRLHSLVEDLGFFVTWEVLQLQRLLGEEGDSQVKVVVPQLVEREGKRVALGAKQGHNSGLNRKMAISFSAVCGLASITVSLNQRAWMRWVHLWIWKLSQTRERVCDLGQWPPECTFNQRTAAKQSASAAAIFHSCTSCSCRPGNNVSPRI